MLTTSVLTMPWTPTPTDGLGHTDTLRSQLETEESISSLLTEHLSSTSSPLLQREQHQAFLARLLRAPLPKAFTGLDASRPWLVYWAVHSLALLDAQLDPASCKRVVETLKACQNPDGGFGGGPGQVSHLAPSYAAVCALVYAGEEGWKAIDRPGMYRFLLSVKQPDGSFIMHQGGEVDVRGCYCALTIATLLNLLTPTLAASTPGFIASCQTYEGGLASSAHPFPSSPLSAPLGEAHGGYAFCAAASWAFLLPFTSPSSPSLLPSTSSTVSKSLDLGALLRWSTSLQATPIEGGGFRGRTNKLVDGCYSWWNGGLVPVVGGLLAEAAGGLCSSSEEDQEGGELFDRSALQQYVVLVAQQPSGGLRDKPGKPADAYHTCYNLSGAASAQHHPSSPSAGGGAYSVKRQRRERETYGGAAVIEEEGGEEVVRILGEGETEEEAERRMREVWSRTWAWGAEGGEGKLVYGGQENELIPTHPLFNVCTADARRAMAFFYGQPAPSS
ncbi:hypothetical protein JCM10207_007759 [Rhodosporidiobolus poonsookiae]